MKKVIIIVSLFVAGAFVSHAQNRCDTLKWKIIETEYVESDGNYYHKIGVLDSAVINIDTLPKTHFAVKIVNISNDTFYANDAIYLSAWTEIYADTGLIGGLQTKASYSYLEENCFPNDTISQMFAYGTDFLSITNSLKAMKGIELETISHWKFIIVVPKTSRDGMYSDSVIFAGADTSTFYIVRGGVGVQEIEKNQSIVSVYPNPAKTYFTVTNTENAEIQLFNILGQKVFQTIGTQENTVVNTAFLPQGLYVLKVVKDNVATVHKVQIVR